jgi:Plasmid pRiA4b ORF-3-like protein
VKAMAKILKQTYQLKISLDGAKPPIWRRVLVANTINLQDLHQLIQIVMGWNDSHLHHFIQGSGWQTVFYAPHQEDDFDSLDSKDEADYQIRQLLKKEKDKITYEYDFGDSWQHTLLLEKILPFEDSHNTPQCIKGKLACPPDDCGGIWDYANLLEILDDPSHPDHKDMLEWIGGEFDPNYFDMAKVNAWLKQAFPGV